MARGRKKTRSSARILRTLFAFDRHSSLHLDSAIHFTAIPSSEPLSNMDSNTLSDAELTTGLMFPLSNTRSVAVHSAPNECTHPKPLQHHVRPRISTPAPCHPPAMPSQRPSHFIRKSILQRDDPSDVHIPGSPILHSPSVISHYQCNHSHKPPKRNRSAMDDCSNPASPELPIKRRKTEKRSTPLRSPFKTQSRRPLPYSPLPPSSPLPQSSPFFYALSPRLPTASSPLQYSSPSSAPRFIIIPGISAIASDGGRELDEESKDGDCEDDSEPGDHIVSLAEAYEMSSETEYDFEAMKKKIFGQAWYQ